jgi:hypothetical protein
LGSTGLWVVYGGERRGSGSEGVASSDKAISWSAILLSKTILGGE